MHVRSPTAHTRTPVVTCSFLFVAQAPTFGRISASVLLALGPQPAATATTPPTKLDASSLASEVAAMAAVSKRSVVARVDEPSPAIAMLQLEIHSGVCALRCTRPSVGAQRAPNLAAHRPNPI
jgi:hypothetical protein